MNIAFSEMPNSQNTYYKNCSLGTANVLAADCQSVIRGNTGDRTKK